MGENSGAASWSVWGRSRPGRLQATRGSGATETRDAAQCLSTWQTSRMMALPFNIAARLRGFALVGITLAAAMPVMAAPDVEEREKPAPDDPKPAAPNPWVDGPDASTEETALTRTSEVPRRDGASEDLSVAPALVPDEALPVVVGARPQPLPSFRFVTELDRAELNRYGPLTLSHALDQVAGLSLSRSNPQQTLLEARGLGASLVDVRIDGVPLLTPAIFPGRSALSFFSLLDVARLTVRHGPQLLAGAGRGVGAVVDVETFDAPRERGEALPLHGAFMGGLGGPDATKTVQLRGETGLGRIRLSLSGSVIDTDDIYLGRGLGVQPASSSQGGTLGARADIAIAPGTWVFASWQSARQSRIPLAGNCRLGGNGGAVDCTRLFDLGRDALVAGGETEQHLLGVTVVATARAHVQRILHHTDRFGAGLTEAQNRIDNALRAGALGSIRFSAPQLGAAIGFDLVPSLEVSLEHRRDRLSSTAFARSLRAADADVRGGLGREVPERSALVDDSLLGVDAAFATARVDAPWGGAALRVRMARDIALAPPTIPAFSRLTEPVVVDNLSTSVEASGRVHVLERLDLFAAGHRIQTGPSLNALTAGPPIEDGRTVGVATPGTTARLFHGGEFGAQLNLAWLTLDVVTYAYSVTGPMAVVEDAAGPHLAPGLDRFGTGVEIRGQWRTGLPGLFADGTLAAPLVDEGTFSFASESGSLPFLNMTPADGVRAPFGHLALRYAPPDNWFSGFTRVRYVAPHARLGATERLETSLCPAGGAPETGSVLPCVGAPGHLSLDVGARIAPTDAFSFEAVGTNLLDQPFAPRTENIPFGGIGVRVQLRVVL